MPTARPVATVVLYSPPRESLWMERWAGRAMMRCFRRPVFPATASSSRFIRPKGSAGPDPNNILGPFMKLSLGVSFKA